MRHAVDRWIHKVYRWIDKWLDWIEDWPISLIQRNPAVQKRLPEIVPAFLRWLGGLTRFVIGIPIALAIYLLIMLPISLLIRPVETTRDLLEAVSEFLSENLMLLAVLTVLLVVPVIIVVLIMRDVNRDEERDRAEYARIRQALAERRSSLLRDVASDPAKAAWLREEAAKALGDLAAMADLPRERRSEAVAYLVDLGAIEVLKRLNQLRLEQAQRDLWPRCQDEGLHRFDFEPPQPPHLPTGSILWLKNGEFAAWMFTGATPDEVDEILTKASHVGCLEFHPSTPSHEESLMITLVSLKERACLAREAFRAEVTVVHEPFYSRPLPRPGRLVFSRVRRAYRGVPDSRGEINSWLARQLNRTYQRRSPAGSSAVSAVSVSAPATFTAYFSAARFDFAVDVTRSWSPLDADRFYGLMQGGSYDRQPLLRLQGSRVVKFGFSDDANIVQPGQQHNLPAGRTSDPGKEGLVAFDRCGPDRQTDTVLVTLEPIADFDKLGFVPFGVVSEGLRALRTAEEIEVDDKDSIVCEAGPYKNTMPTARYLKERASELRDRIQFTRVHTCRDWVKCQLIWPSCRRSFVP